MTVLDVKMLVKCPKDEAEVNVKKCMDCDHRKHISFEGAAKAYVTCLFPEVRKKKDVLWG